MLQQFKMYGVFFFSFCATAVEKLLFYFMLSIAVTHFALSITTLLSHKPMMAI